MGWESTSCLPVVVHVYIRNTPHTHTHIFTNTSIITAESNWLKSAKVGLCYRRSMWGKCSKEWITYGRWEDDVKSDVNVWKRETGKWDLEISLKICVNYTGREVQLDFWFVTTWTSYYWQWWPWSSLVAARTNTLCRSSTTVIWKQSLSESLKCIFL